MDRFDVFLCHNTNDKQKVRAIGEGLKRAGLNPWFDEWNLDPGDVWIEELQRQIQDIDSVAVFFGPSGSGRWQKAEIQSALSIAIEHGLRIIPVLLPGFSEADIPIFLRRYQTVTFESESDQTALERLIRGVHKARPNAARGARRVKCFNCDNLILPVTAKMNHGLCGQCRSPAQPGIPKFGFVLKGRTARNARRVKCLNCDNLILPITAEVNKGLCGRCKQG